MNKELDEKLCKDFPLTFADRHASMQVTAMCWGFPGDGWYGIIREAAEKLEPLIAAYKLEYEGDSAPRASQVKEKFGTMRFYLSHGTDEMHKIVEEAEQKSEEICEECGKSGSLRRDGWWITACDDCHKERRNVRNES